MLCQYNLNSPILQSSSIIVESVLSKLESARFLFNDYTNNVQQDKIFVLLLPRMIWIEMPVFISFNNHRSVGGSPTIVSATVEKLLHMNEFTDLSACKLTPYRLSCY